MRISTGLRALLLAALFCVVFGLMVYLGGCSARVTPPPPPGMSVYFSWGAVNNPFPDCPSSAGPCNNYLVIVDQTLGQVVTSPNPGTHAYTQTPAPGGALHQYALYTHILNPDGTSSDSEQTMAVSTTP